MTSVFDNMPPLIQPKFEKGRELPVVEYFHSIQGEGDDIGKRVMFIRTPLCQLRCSWCDSAYAVLGHGVTNYSYDDIIKLILEDYDVDRVIWTGGEPTIYFKQITEIWNKMVSVISDKSDNDYINVPQFAFETNGTLYRPEYENYSFMFTVSPKLGSSDQGQKMNFEALQNFIKHTKCQFKFVVKDDNDLQQIYSVLQQLNFPTRDSEQHVEVILQPEWFQFEQLVGANGDFWKPYGLFMKDLTEKLLASKEWSQYSWRVLPQMHKWLWGNIAGV